LKNIRNIADNLDDEEQHSLMKLVTAASIGRERISLVIEYILQDGKPGGRREAVLALADYNGAAANYLATRALSDPDPQVQANVLPQLRRRGIPGILQRLIDMLDSPHLVVRQSARNVLVEFSFPRFVSSFDLLDEDTRISTAALVKKVDHQVVPLLREELKSPIGSRRLRALHITRIMDFADDVEDLLIDMLNSEDHATRVEAAETLSKCRSPAAKAALWEAAYDKNVIIREAAQRSLDEQKNKL
jgi:HEAT repeat protein